MSQNLAAIPLSRDNIEAALLLAKRCFPKKSDQKLLSLDFYAFVRGKTTMQDELLKQASTVVGYFLFLDNGIPVGTGGAYEYDDDSLSMWICWIGVEPSKQRQGFGKMIVGHLCNLATERGRNVIKCVTSDDFANSQVHAFWESLGFQKEQNLTYRNEILRLYARRATRL